MEDGKKEMKINILYEDNHILVVEKPINILSQSDNTKDMDLLTLVKKYIKEKYQKPGNVYVGLIHRLDRPVGGIMVFAKTSKAASRLSKQVQEHKIKKYYLAIVNGIIKQEKGTFEDKIKRLANGNSVIRKDGKMARLDYEVLERNKKENMSLVKISLKTGRHHQIRVQLSSRDHSIYGDAKYGGRGHGKQIALWAYSLTIEHPITKERMNFKDLPKLEGSWKILEDVKLAK